MFSLFDETEEGGCGNVAARTLKGGSDETLKPTSFLARTLN